MWAGWYAGEEGELLGGVRALLAHTCSEGLQLPGQSLEVGWALLC